MSRKRKSRVYWRFQGGERRAYGDFRDLGGGREALIPPKAKRATTDPDIALELVAQRVRELEQRRRHGVILDIEEEALLGVATGEDLGEHGEHLTLHVP